LLASSLVGDHSYTDLTDLEAKCQSDDDDGTDFAGLASKCCSDGVSVCGEEKEYPTCILDCDQCMQDGNYACASDCSDADIFDACSMCSYDGFDMMAARQAGVCPVGTCFRGDNTVQSKAASSALRQVGASTTKLLSELKVGDMVATADLDAAEHHQMKWTKVVALPHSKSTADFIEVTMDASSSSTSTPQVVTVTEHHTFPTCHSKAFNKVYHMKSTVSAHMLKAGDCLLTSAGKSTVAKVQRLQAGPDDQTYTVELEGGHDLIMLGGVVTHAKPQTAPASLTKKGTTMSMHASQALTSKAFKNLLKRN
jgi:hypothetical protein